MLGTNMFIQLKIWWGICVLGKCCHAYFTCWCRG